MSQTFIVLRNDQQQGPFNLEQLQGFGLRPDDMVWVEGQSAAWQRASVTPQLKNFPFASDASTAATTFVPEPEAEPIYFPQAKSAVKQPTSTWVVASLAIFLLGGGAWLLLKPTSAKKTVAATPVFTSSDSLLAATGDSVQFTTAQMAEEQTLTEPGLLAQTEKKAQAASKSSTRDKVVDSVAINDRNNDLSPVVPTQSETEPVTETKPSPSTETPASPTGEPAPKKKSVLEKIDDWVQNNDVLGPQKKTVEKDVTDGVQVRLRISADEFMMGVRNGQVVLQNNSGLRLRSAKTEVVYYNEKGEVLDRKTVSFGAVEKGATATAAAPDHRTAERAEVTLLSATGISKE